MDYEHIPVLKISPKSVSYYSEHSHIFKGDPIQPDCETLIKLRQHEGNLSQQGKKNLIESIERFYFFLQRANETKRAQKIKTKRTLKFVTLTLASAQIHSDNEIRKILLNQFLTEMREKFGLKNYIWKAEKQQNGNIHFHVIIDIFISHLEIRQIWNRIQNKLGYVDRFRSNIASLGFDSYFDNCRKNNSQISSDIIVQRWQKGQRENWSNPPGTEIRQVEKVRKIGSYFAKYFSKASYLDPGFGRIWFASRNISQDVSIRVNAYKEIMELGHYLREYFPNKLKYYDYCTVFWVDFRLYEKDCPLKLIQHVRKVFDKHSLNFW